MLKAYFLGEMRVTTTGGLEIDLPTKRSKLLFAYLFMKRGQWLNRETLADDVWDGSHGDAKKALRNELSVITTALERAGQHPESFIERQDGCLRGVQSDEIWLDVDAFETGDTSSPELDTSALTDLYKGEFLPGYFENWTHLPREIYRQRYLIKLDQEMRRHQDNRKWDEAIILASRLLDCDPLREASHRSLMLLHYFSGNRGAALLQFDRCRKLMRDELQIEPMAETVALRQAILKEDFSAISSEPNAAHSETSGQTAMSPEIIRQLSDTRDVIDQLLQSSAPS